MHANPSTTTALLLALGSAHCGGVVVSTGRADDSGLDGEDVAAETATHGCTDDRFVDRSAGADGDRTIVVAPGNQYDPPCLAVRAGQTVTFTGNFSAHPLAPGVAPRRSGAGATPSPIEMRSEGTVYRVQFSTSGDYPYYCVYHAGGGMYGVIRVMP